MRGNFDEMLAELRRQMTFSASKTATSTAADFAAEQRAKVRRRLESSLPAIPANWQEFVHPRIAEAIEQWRWGHGNLVLLGHTGCGKTLGAAVLARRLIREARAPRDWHRARRLVFVDAARLAIAREQHGLGQGEAPLVERCLRAPVLFLDELGYLDRDTGVVEQVIDARSKASQPLVVTSGMTPEEIVERYGAATARKLLECRHLVTQLFGE